MSALPFPQLSTAAQHAGATNVRLRLCRAGGNSHPPGCCERLHLVYQHKHQRVWLLHHLLHAHGRMAGWSGRGGLAAGWLPAGCAILQAGRCLTGQRLRQRSPACLEGLPATSRTAQRTWIFANSRLTSLPLSLNHLLNRL